MRAGGLLRDVLLETLRPPASLRSRAEVLLLRRRSRTGQIHALEVTGPVRRPSPHHRLLEGLAEVRLVRWAMVESLGRGREAAGLEGFEFGVEEAGVGIVGAEALVGRGLLGAEAVLLESAVEGGLLLELLERVGGAAEGVGHGG